MVDADSTAKRVKLGNGQDAPELWKAKRFAVKFQPPCILLEYEDSTLKKRVRQVKLTRVPADVDVDRFTRKVIRSFPRQLDPASVKYDQVRKLVIKLLESMQHMQLGSGDGPDPQRQQAASSGKPGSMMLNTLKPESINGASPATPRLMPCLSPSIPLPGSARHAPLVNNQSIESTDRFSTSTFGAYGRESKEELDLDDLDSALNDLDRELGGTGGSPAPHMANGSAAAGFSPNGIHPPALPVNQQLKASAGAAAAAQPPTPLDDTKKSRVAQEETEDCLVLEVDIQGHVDLNKVSDMELKLAKQQMEEDFLRNQLKPGHPEFQYDKQVEFAPATEANDWDESGDEEEPEEAPQAESKAAASSKAAAGLRIQVNADEEDEEEDAAEGRRGSDEGSPQSVSDDVSPNRVAIDTDSDLDLDLP